MSWAPPSASIRFGENLEHIRVYAVGPDGQIMEWQWDDKGKWTGPSAISTNVKAQVGSTMTAVANGSHIRVYYQGQDGGVYEVAYEDHWNKGSKLP